MYVAMDCEMVGVGYNGLTSIAARVTIIDWYNTILLDQYIKPDEPVTDYRTYVSGITPEDIWYNPQAVDLATCRNAVAQILQNKILVGHGLRNDLFVLQIYHPWQMIRDTARYEPFMKVRTILYPSVPSSSCESSSSSFESSSRSSSFDETESHYNSHDSITATTTGITTTMLYDTTAPEMVVLLPRKLKELCYEKLDGLMIQSYDRPHSPYEDSVAALQLYKLVQRKWEKMMQYKIKKTEKIVKKQIKKQYKKQQKQQQAMLEADYAAVTGDTIAATTNDGDEYDDDNHEWQQYYNQHQYDGTSEQGDDDIIYSYGAQQEECYDDNDNCNDDA